jgi:hypothetical protein
VPPTETPTETPTNTPVPPTETPTEIPTDTPVPPTETPTEIPTPTFTPTPVPATIGDYVWEDLNENGLQDGDEAGFPGILVELYRTDNSLVASMMTDGNGFYLFTDLAPGDYYLKFYPYPGVAFTAQDAGDDSLDSDADPGTGQTAPTTLDPGEDDRSWDAGMITNPG